MATKKKPEEMMAVTEEVTEVAPQSPSPTPPPKPQEVPLADRSMANANKYILSPEDRAALESIGKSYDNNAPVADRVQKHNEAEAIRNRWGYSGGPDGSEYKPIGMNAQLQDMKNAAEEQAKKQIDYAVNQGVTELERANADAQEKFDTQLAQNAREEKKALDNHALYMEARGDRGGVGHAQYGQIQAQALRNQQTINSNRTKLATDTERQIADLRARGEFEKADKILAITQDYLGRLFQLQQWNAEYQMSQKQFNESIRQWQEEFDLSVGQMMGEYNGRPTFQAQQANAEKLVSTGNALLANGIMPTPAQLEAMGMDKAQANAMIARYKYQQQLAERELALKYSNRGGSSSGKKKGSSGGSGNSGSSSSGGGMDIFESMYANNVSPNKAYAYLVDHDYTSGEAEKIAAQYEDMQKDLRDWWFHYDGAGVANNYGGSGANAWVDVPGFGKMRWDQLQSNMYVSKKIGGKFVPKIVKKMTADGTILYEKHPDWE